MTDEEYIKYMIEKRKSEQWFQNNI
jgi:hypothetical protein